MELKKLFIITDFDHTITDKDSNSSWGVLESSTLLSKESRKECEKYKNYYMPIEKDCTISEEEKSKYMKQWLEKNLNIFIKSKLTEKEIDRVSSKKDCMKLRKGSKEFLKFTNKYQIPVIIISAGISNIIENFLKTNDLLFNNIYIVSNIIKYKEGYIKGFRNEAIHSLNKNEIKLPSKIEEIIKEKEKIVLLGDNVEDIYMIPKGRENNTFKIGFLNGHKNNRKKYNETFDIVYDDESFTNVIDILKNTHD
ncbi:MAG: haloacid dehalogenase-like hydrolase [Bacilli bacterium]|nr:haloacid dehalogenase-like hydrolase [Bacilli bacterium]